MIKLVKKYQKLNYLKKASFTLLFSIIFNAFLAIIKLIMAFTFDIFFLGASILNIFILISKIECYLAIKHKEKRSVTFRNNIIGIFLLLAGIQYALYLGRFIYADVESFKYDMILGIAIACVSFIEMGFAIYGCFYIHGKGKIFRNIKLINLCSALTAIVLTEIALMSFASSEDNSFINGIFGIAIGVIIILIAVFILISPKISILDREYNEYELISNDDNNENEITIKLTNSKFYRNYYYQGEKDGKIVKGYIKKGKCPIWKWNIFVLIIVFTLSEILIFPYAFMALVFYFKNASLIKKLDKEMLDKGYKKNEKKEETLC